MNAWKIVKVLVKVAVKVTFSPKSEKSKQASKNAISLLENFVFVWVLLGLLAFYIVSIQIGSAIIFATGNIFVEAVLIVYLVKNRKRESE